MIYAHIVGGVVVELFEPPAGVPMSECFHPSLTWVECTSVTGIAAGWTAVENGAGLWTFAAPVVPAPSLAQQAATLLSGGLTITSTSTPALNGVYSVSPTMQSYINSELLSATVNGTFADGTTSLAWPTADGSVHTFQSIVEFKAFGTAVANFVALCQRAQLPGSTASLPSASVTIA